MITNKIIEAYDKLCKDYGIEAEAAIRISPTGFHMLMSERMEYSNMIYRDEYNNQWVEIYGVILPIIIDERIPEDILVMVQSRQDYERQEMKELQEKFIRMFGRR